MYAPYIDVLITSVDVGWRKVFLERTGDATGYGETRKVHSLGELIRLWTWRSWRRTLPPKENSPLPSLQLILAASDRF